jgi:hypothetical protein
MATLKPKEQQMSSRRAARLGGHQPECARTRFGAIAIAALLAVGLVAAGCSSSGTSSTTSIPALSKADFVSQANAICAKGNKLTDAAGGALGNSSNQAEVNDAVTNTIVPAIQDQIDGIKALAPPSGDETTVSSMLALAQTDVDKLKGNPELLSDPNLFADFAKAAHPYGLTSCAPDS